MTWITQKTRPVELFGYRVAEISDGMATSYARIGRVQLLGRILNSYMRGYQLDGNDYAEVRRDLCLIIHPRFTASSDGVIHPRFTASSDQPKGSALPQRKRGTRRTQ